MIDTFSEIQKKQPFHPPDGWKLFRTIDMHTGGEPLRVILDGFPEPQGNSVLERRRYAQTHCDHWRRALMHEPRGHTDMYGCVLVPPNDEGADFGILFMHNEGYSTMCGHAVIAITKLAVEMGWVEAREPETELTIDAPCGRITSFAKVENKKVQSVYFYGVPSFVIALGQKIEVPGMGMVTFDLAYGGAFYAFVNADSCNLTLTPGNYRRLIRKGMDIKRAIVANSQQVRHPFEEDLSFLYGTIFIGGPVTKGIDSRNVCVFADGEVDRCPTGSGVSGRLPIHYLRGDIGIGEKMTIESITGSVFTGSVLREVEYGPHRAVIPCVEGTAHITGQHEFLIDPEDPFKEGFLLNKYGS